MVSYVDICLFSQNLATTQRLSRDELRDRATFNMEEEHIAVALGGRALESFIPIFNGQYHIDFWLSEVEFVFVNSFVPEKNKCDCVASYLSEDVRQAYDSMQWSRIHRGEAGISDWPTLKTLLRCVFLPLMEQLHTTVNLNHLPSPLGSKKKKNIISTTTTQQPAEADLLRKVDSLSLSLSTCSCSCSTKKIHDKHEKDVQFLKEKIAESRLKLAEIQDVLGGCSTMLDDKHERDVPLKKGMDALLGSELARQSRLLGLYRTNY